MGNFDIAVSEIDLHFVPACRGLRLDLVVILSRKDQKAAFCTGVLDRDDHQSLDQFPKEDLTGDSLRSLDHGHQVELIKRVTNRCRCLLR
jgi:hypothetical protein